MRMNYLFYGYSNSIVVSNMIVRTCSATEDALVWRSLQFEMSALNYWCQISMGDAAVKDYNIQFDNDKYKNSETQKFQETLNSGY